MLNLLVRFSGLNYYTKESRGPLSVHVRCLFVFFALSDLFACLCMFEQNKWLEIDPGNESETIAKVSL